MKLKTILFSITSGISVILFELLMALPSHPECGTAGIDYMPCAYSDRLIWYLNGGSWAIPLILWIIANAIFISVTKNAIKTDRRLKKSSSSGLIETTYRFAPVVLSLLAVALGSLLIDTPEPKTAGISIDDIPNLFYIIDMGWTLFWLGVTVFTFLTIQLLFRAKRVSIYSTPRKPAIYIYANLSLIYLVWLGSIRIVFEADRGYFPPDADSIGIPIMGLLFTYILLVAPVNVITFLLLRKYRSGIGIHNPYKIPSTDTALFTLIIGLLVLLLFYSIATVQFDIASLTVLALMSWVCILLGAQKKVGSPKPAKARS